MTLYKSTSIPIIKINKLIITTLLAYVTLPDVAFSQATEPTYPTIDLCRDWRTLPHAPAAYSTFDSEDESREVYLSAASLAAINAATVVSLNTLKGGCDPSKTDSGLFLDLVDQSKKRLYKVRQWIPEKLPKNIGAFIITDVASAPIMYLMTYRIPAKGDICPQIINTVIIDFWIATKHWHHGRISELIDATEIYLNCQCRLREEEADDPDNHIARQEVFAAMQPDGTITVRKSRP